MKTKEEIIELCVEVVGLWRSSHDAKLYRKKIIPWLEAKFDKESENDKMEVSFWVMTDSHQFIKLEETTLERIKASAIATCEKHPWGMLCRPIILRNGTEIKRIGENEPITNNGGVNIKRWFKSVKNDEDIKKIFKNEKV